MLTIEIILFTLFVFLLILWLTMTERERRTRSDGREIPRYLISYVGNSIGLGALMLATTPSLHHLTICEVVVCILAGLTVCLYLHQYWITQSKQQTIGMYQNGSTTPAGWVHLLFIWIVGSCLCSIVFTYTELTTLSRLWFGIATIVYWGSYSIDHFYRKVL
jgi:hypothetical protein